MSTVQDNESDFVDGQELEIRLTQADIDSLKVPADLFGPPIQLKHRADHCSRYSTTFRKGGPLPSGLPCEIEFQVTDVNDFRQLSLQQYEVGSIDVNVKKNPSTGVSLNTAWHGSLSMTSEAPVTLKHSKRGFETSWAVSQHGATVKRITNELGRSIKTRRLPPVSVDIVARLIVKDSDVATVAKMMQERYSTATMVEGMVEGVLDED